MSLPRTLPRLTILSILLLSAIMATGAQNPAIGRRAPALAVGKAPAAPANKDAGKDKESGLDILSDLEADKTAADLQGLRFSHLSVVESWKQVEPYQPRLKVAGAEYRWKMAQGFASPTSNLPISTLIDVPKDGEYRLYLRHSVAQAQPFPLKLSIEPLRVVQPGKTGNAADIPSVEYEPAGAAAMHKFGEFRLLAGTLGKEQEQRLPLRFESEVQLNTFPDPTVFVWEYRDVRLAKGPYRVSLQSDRPDNRVSALFLTQSKLFRPSFAPSNWDNTLEGVFLRYRVVKGSTAPQFSAATSVTYHWPGRKAGNSTEPLWYDHTEPLTKVPSKDWSSFLDVREQVIPGGGPWSTWRPALTGISEGEIEVQFAWNPYESAVMRTFRAAVGNGKAMFRVPHGRYSYRTPVTAAAWGVWNPAILEGLSPEDSLLERYFTWAENAMRTLGLAPDHPKPKLLHVLTSCRTGPANQARAAEMLAKLGVNWIPDAPAEVASKYGLYDDSAAKKVNTGDEIGTHTAADVVNGDPALRAGFQEYLREQARVNGMSERDFLGVDDLRRVECIDRLPENAGRFERRQFYCSQRYVHLATIPTYARQVRTIEKEKPHALIYNNYSPHPLFLTGRDMNGSDWFLLPRAGAQTLGWAEDWATGGSWGLGTPMGECTTFYAALVDCAVRSRGYPSGFYVGSNCGFSAQKMFSCVSQGTTILHLYDWGPIDAWAEGSNAWSEMEGQYLSILQGTHALGPADEIIVKGKREPRRTAVLYNRSHEIVSGSKVWLNRDWMWTFLGLRNSQIPVDVIIEEDLRKDALDRYDVLFLGGLNLERRHIRELQSWVERGGVLIGSAGCAMSDVFGDPMAETEELFGATQRLAMPEDDHSRAKVHFHGTEDFPDVELDAATAGDQKYILMPTTAKVAATYDGGDTAATVRELGRGKAILLGLTPGEMYRAAGGARGGARQWLATPVVKRLGRSRAEFDCPESEVTVFDHPSGTAVLIGLYTVKPLELSKEPGHLSVKVEREVHEVTSALHGPLKWELRDGRIEIQTPPPAQCPVDTVILR